MKTVCMMVLVLLGGCASYTRVQMDLVEQSRKGIELLGHSHANQVRLIDEYHALQRKRIDEAFDADVLERKALTGDWVIEHRRAYAAALDVVFRQRAASTEADAVTRRNLQAVEQALRQLEWLQSIQLKWSFPKEVPQ